MTTHPNAKYAGSEDFKVACAELKAISDSNGESMGKITLSEVHSQAFNELCEQAGIESTAEAQGRVLLVQCSQLREVFGEVPVPKPTTEEDASPVADMNAAEARESVGRMTSTEKLQSVVTLDSRKSVQDAARSRLAELGG